MRSVGCPLYWLLTWTLGLGAPQRRAQNPGAILCEAAQNRSSALACGAIFILLDVPPSRKQQVTCLINADLSDARFHRDVESGRMFHARSINPLERGRPVCGGRGPYGNSIMGRSGVEVRHGRAPGCTT